MFFKTKKPIVLNCYTFRPDVYYHAPIIEAKKLKPKWLKDLPKKPEIDGDTLYTKINMRHCTGVQNFLNKGAIIPMWSSLRIEMSPIGETSYRYRFADEKSSAEHHAAGQRGGYLPETEYQHLKLISPWAFTCEEDVEFMSVSPYYYQENPFEYTVMTGVLNFKDQPTTNVNIILPKNNEYKMVDIDADSPMMQIFPLSERPLVIKTHLVTAEEYNKIVESRRAIRYFFSDYAKSKSNTNRKCPFHK